MLEERKDNIIYGMDFQDLLSDSKSVFKKDDIFYGEWLLAFCYFRLFCLGISTSIKTFLLNLDNLTKNSIIIEGSELNWDWLKDFTLEERFLLEILPFTKKKFSYVNYMHYSVLIIPSFWINFIAFAQLQQIYCSDKKESFNELLFTVSYANLLTFLKQELVNDFEKISEKKNFLVKQIISSQDEITRIINPSKLLDLMLYIGHYNYPYLITCLKFNIQMQQMEILPKTYPNLDFYFYDFFNYWVPFSKQDISFYEAMEEFSAFFKKNTNLGKYVTELIKSFSHHVEISEYWCFILPNKKTNEFVSSVFSEEFSKEGKQPVLATALMAQFLEVWADRELNSK